MKYLLATYIFFACILYADNYIIEKESKETNSTISKRALSFQEFAIQREERAKQLEEDGFCACGD